MKPIIELKNVSKVYSPGKASETWSIREATMHVFPQEYIILFGPSGSGKSTLLNMIAGLERPSSGSVEVAGKDLLSLDEHEIMQFHLSAIGIIFQAFYLIAGLSVRDNILLPQIFKGESTANRSERLRVLGERFGILDLFPKKATQLSGGQQQRVATARALINNPEIILADEPVGNLDSKNTDITMEMLAELNIKDKKTVILVTHDPRFLPYADRVYYLKDGRIIKETINPDKISKTGAKVESSELDKLASLYPYLDEVGLRAKMILNEIFFSLSVDQITRAEKSVTEFLLRKISHNELLQQFDASVDKGGVGLNSQTARKITEKITGFSNELELSEKGTPLFIEEPHGRVAEIRKYLLSDFRHDFTLAQIKRLDDTLYLREEGKISGSEFVQIISHSYHKGGAGINKRTARTLSRELDIILIKNKS